MQKYFLRAVTSSGVYSDDSPSAAIIGRDRDRSPWKGPNENNESALRRLCLFSHLSIITCTVIHSAPLARTYRKTRGKQFLLVKSSSVFASSPVLSFFREMNSQTYPFNDLVAVRPAMCGKTDVVGANTWTHFHVTFREIKQPKSEVSDEK